MPSGSGGGAGVLPDGVVADSQQLSRLTDSQFRHEWMVTAAAETPTKRRPSADEAPDRPRDTRDTPRKNA